MEKKKLSEEKYEEKVINLLAKIVDQTKPKQESSEPEVIKGGHKTLAEKMLCPDCNPREQYRIAHLELMGQKECKDCGNIDRKEEEDCSECGEEYPKAET